MPAMRDGAGRWRTALAVCTFLGAAVWVVVWVAAAVTMADRGFDVTDEGASLLSYRWWDTNLRNFTAAQYVYGPVFELLDFDIVRLRLFRVVTVLVASGFFGWAFARWLSVRRGWSTRVWELATATAVVASAWMMFSWLPLSPGYNDLTGLMALVGLGLVMRAGTLVEQDRTVPWWLFLALGTASAVMVMGRWSAVVAAALLVFGALSVSAGAHWSRWVAGLVWTLSGAVLVLLVIHVFMVPVDDAIRGLLGPNRLTSDGDHSPRALLARYWESTVDLVWASLGRYWPVLAAAAVAGLVSRGRWGLVTGAIGVGTLAFAVVQTLADEPVLDAIGYRDRFGAGLLALALTVIVTGLGVACSTRWRKRHWSGREGRAAVLAVLLLVVPFAAGFGTNNRLWMLAVNLFAVTIAFLITVLTHIDRRRLGARALAVATIAVAVAASSVTARDALLNHPYRSVPAEAATTVVGDGTTPWGAVRVSAGDAEEYEGLRTALAPYLEVTPASVLALERMSGIVLLLDARPVGEPWTGPAARARSAAGLREECETGMLPRPPILLFNRPPDEGDDRALAACGLDLDKDYRVVETPAGPRSPTVYAPAR